MNIPVYVISLARVVKRRAEITARLNTTAVQSELVDAIDGLELDLSTLQHRIVNKRMSRGEIGCFLSHYNLWQRMVDSQTPYAVILEDDATWDDDFFTVAAQLPAVSWQWDVINLCYEHRIRVDTTLCKVGNRCLVRNVRPTNRAIGYAVSLSGAAKMLKHCYRMRQGVDLQRRKYWQYGLTFYAVDPPLGRQSGLPSTTGTESLPPKSIGLRGRQKILRLYDKTRYAIYNTLHKPRANHE